jgi:hypothetical protein
VVDWQRESHNLRSTIIRRSMDRYGELLALEMVYEFVLCFRSLLKSTNPFISNYRNRYDYIRRLRLAPVPR